MRVANASAHMQPPRSPSVSGAGRDSLLENTNQGWRANVSCVLVARVLLLGLVLHSATPARAAQNRQAENPPKNDPELVGSIEGEVVDRDTRQPVSGALVLVEGTSLSAVVGNDGRFRIENVPATVYIVRAEGPGYVPLSSPELKVSVDSIGHCHPRTHTFTQHPRRGPCYDGDRFEAGERDDQQRRDGPRRSPSLRGLDG